MGMRKQSILTNEQGKLLFGFGKFEKQFRFKIKII